MLQLSQVFSSTPYTSASLTKVDGVLCLIACKHALLDGMYLLQYLMVLLLLLLVLSPSCH